MGIRDIFFVLFQHKWKIFLLTILGFAAAGAVAYLRGPLYQSRAKLLVKYVKGTSSVDSWESQKEAGGRYGEHVIDTEIEILTSWDLALGVVDAVGVERLVPEVQPAEGAGILSKVVGGGLETADDAAAGAGEDPRRTAAAGGILSNLEVFSRRGGNVLHLNYRHEDPRRVQLILNNLVEQYFDAHLAIHRPVREEYDELKNRARELRFELPALRASLEELQSDLRDESRGDTAASLEEQLASARVVLVQTRADAAQQKKRLEELAKLEGDIPQTDGEVEAADLTAMPHPHVVQEYENFLSLERMLQRKKLELATKFKSGNPALQTVKNQIEDSRRQRAELVRKHPALATVAVARQSTDGMPVDVRFEGVLLAALNAKVQAYEEQLSQLETHYRKVSEMEAEIARTEQKIEEGAAALQRIDERLKLAEHERQIDHRSMPNISIVQHPTAPSRTYSKATKKLILGLAASGFGLGVALAFLIELLLDSRVKRSGEIESRMRIPLMLSIPYLKKAGAYLAGPQQARLTGPKAEGDVPAEVRVAGREAGNGRSRRFMTPYADAIRDRILHFFELNDMRHKPKLVALTGLTPGAGTSTLLAGLAKSFTEYDEAKVLVVDLNPAHRGRSPAYERLASHSLPRALVAGKDGPIETADGNLFIASPHRSENGNGMERFSTKNLFDLMPKMRASNFDYIFFDLPPVSETSPTAVMAGFMDQVLLVLDAERTDREKLKKAHSQLARGKADVSCVFNKTRLHAPGWVLQES